jgi:hypothetical protein
MRTLVTTVALAVLLAAPAMAQTAPSAAATAPVPAPPADTTASPEAIVNAVYAVISGPPTKPRDWDRLRGLMVPGGVFMVAGVPRTGGNVRARVLSIDDYINGSSKALATEGFYEHGAMQTVWRYAHIATVTSPYESRHAPDGPPFQRGINQFELMFDGTRWWVVSIYWEGETPANPLPPESVTALKAH